MLLRTAEMANGVLLPKFYVNIIAVGYGRRVLRVPKGVDCKDEFICE